MDRENIENLIPTASEHKFKSFTILAFYYSQGAFKGTDKKFREFRSFIIKEAEKRNYDDPLKLIDYFADHKKELIKLFKKKEYKFSKKVKEKLKAELIKVSIPSLEQKFPVTKYNQLSIFNEIKDKELIKEASDLNIKVIGWDLTKAQDQAVFAIQKIYSKYGYRGNINNNSNALKFTPAEFYEAFGLLKYDYRGKEIYSSITFG